MSLQIIVGSTSQHKISAVQVACCKVFPASMKITITGEKSASGQNEQPVGLEETYNGALFRAMSIHGKLTGKGAVVGIESGIIRADSEALVIDLAVIVIITDKAREIVTTSTGIRFPCACVMAAEMKGFATTTVGSVIAEQFGGDCTDPHSVLTNGAVCRHQTLVDGLVAGFAQLKH